MLTDGWIRAYWSWYSEDMPTVTPQSLTPETLLWLERYPEWDPRLRLVSPLEREEILAERASGDYDPNLAAMHPELADNNGLAEIACWLGDHDTHCLAAMGRAQDMAMGRIYLESMGMLEIEGDAGNGDDGEPEGDIMDGIPEWFIGPLLEEVDHVTRSGTRSVFGTTSSASELVSYDGRDELRRASRDRSPISLVR